VWFASATKAFLTTETIGKSLFASHQSASFVGYLVPDNCVRRSKLHMSSVVLELSKDSKVTLRSLWSRFCTASSVKSVRVRSKVDQLDTQGRARSALTDGQTRQNRFLQKKNAWKLSCPRPDPPTCIHLLYVLLPIDSGTSPRSLLITPGTRYRQRSLLSIGTSVLECRFRSV